MTLKEGEIQILSHKMAVSVPLASATSPSKKIVAVSNQRRLIYIFQRQGTPEHTYERGQGFC